MSRALTALGLAIAALLCSCSGEPPAIARVSTQLLYVQDLAAGTVQEELSVHVIPEDEDGLDDLEYLHVVSDAQELYWTLDSSTWTRTRAGSEDWLGTARLAMPPGAVFPRGEYRLLLYDLAGDSDEERFHLTARTPDPEQIPFPSATIADDRITISGTFPWYTLLVYSTSDAYVRSYPAQTEGIDAGVIRRSDALLRGGFRFWIYVYWSAEALGLLSGPYSVE